MQVLRSGSGSRNSVGCAAHEAPQLGDNDMTEVFLGQIMLAGFNFSPRGFATCDGQLLPISQNQALFSLLGTQYGGNGTRSAEHTSELKSLMRISYAFF